jgi:N-acetylmuramoyl-L-alanine amidase
MADYLIYSVVGLGISLMLYRSFLKKEKLFVFNRFFLLGSLCLCLLAPVLQIDYGFNFASVKTINVEEIIVSEEFIAEDPVKETVQTFSAPTFSYGDLFSILYWTVTALLLARFAKNLLSLLLLVNRKGTGSIGDLKTVSLKERGNPYSFFNYLFIHPRDLKDDRYLDLVLIHEKAHSRQLHSADILCTELLSCFFWFNPFLWFYKKEILENHEYLADEAVVKAGGNREEYGAQLIKSGSKIAQPLLSGFSFIQTKNRLHMLHTKRSSTSRIALKTGICLILFAAVFAVSSFRTNTTTGPFIVVVDAGHGGKDTGNRGQGPNEKELNLSIANKLRALGNEQEVKIVLLRENDQFLSLEERLNFVKAQEAHLFLSLHCNASSNPGRSGAEVIFSPESVNATTSRAYSSLLAAELISTIGTAEVKSANFFVLKNSGIPAVLIEMGFMTNSRDLGLLRDEATQQQLANDIYRGLLAIKKERIIK